MIHLNLGPTLLLIYELEVEKEISSHTPDQTPDRTDKALKKSAQNTTCLKLQVIAIEFYASLKSLGILCLSLIKKPYLIIRVCVSPTNEALTAANNKIKIDERIQQLYLCIIGLLSSSLIGWCDSGWNYDIHFALGLVSTKREEKENKAKEVEKPLTVEEQRFINQSEATPKDSEPQLAKNEDELKAVSARPKTPPGRRPPDNDFSYSEKLTPQERLLKKMKAEKENLLQRLKILDAKTPYDIAQQKVEQLRVNGPSQELTQAEAMLAFIEASPIYAHMKEQENINRKEKESIRAKLAQIESEIEKARAA